VATAASAGAAQAAVGRWLAGDTPAVSGRHAASARRCARWPVTGRTDEDNPAAPAAIHAGEPYAVDALIMVGDDGTDAVRPIGDCLAVMELISSSEPSLSR
jgi:hypothetical protein